MKICIDCFLDHELKSIVKTLNKNGKCDVCNTEKEFIYDTKIDTALEKPFINLLERYTLKSKLGSTYPSKLTVSLKSEFKNKWNVFNNLTESQIYEILVNICSDKYRETPELFDDLVGVAELADEDYLKENTLFNAESWEDFVDELKYVTRFHSEKFNTNKFSIYLNMLAVTIHKDKKLYRGRISDNKGYDVSELGIVEPGKSKAGRANPRGISYLYLADSVKTILHELRLTKMNYVTTAEFTLKKNGNIIDLTKIEKISPFSFENEELITLHIVNKNNLERIHSEIIKPVTNEDSYLDYIPTQYIFDFIKKNKNLLSGRKKELNSDDTIIGVKYKSSLNSKGVNYAFFSEEYFHKDNPIVYKIDEVVYTEVECRL